jgi:hypothetical protein
MLTICPQIKTEADEDGARYSGQVSAWEVTVRDIQVKIYTSLGIV